MLKFTRLGLVFLSLFALTVASPIAQAQAELPDLYSCSPDQERVYFEETPYPKMITIASLSTLGTAIAAWAEPNKNGKHNPAWTVANVFAWGVGAFAGPDCHDIPGHYVDGVAVGEDKLAIWPLPRETQIQLLKKFAAVHAVNFLILSGIYIDADSPGVKTAAIFSLFSPLVAYGFHEWQTISWEREKRKSTSWIQLPTLAGGVVPESNSTRFALSLSAEWP